MKYQNTHSKRIEVTVPALVSRRGSKVITISLARYKLLKGVWLEVEIGNKVRRQNFYASGIEAAKEFRKTVKLYRLNTEGVCA